MKAANEQNHSVLTINFHATNHEHKFLSSFMQANNVTVPAKYIVYSNYYLVYFNK